MTDASLRGPCVHDYADVTMCPSCMRVVGALHAADYMAESIEECLAATTPEGIGMAKAHMREAVGSYRWTLKERGTGGEAG